MKKIYLVIIIVVILIVAWLFVRFVIGGPEDSWIKDDRGVWIKHGNPSQTHENVISQQEAINAALVLYQEKKDQGMNFSSQCLGSVNGYAVDIVHVPRINTDNLLENQCEDFVKGNINKFIELDSDGVIVKIEE